MSDDCRLLKQDGVIHMKCDVTVIGGGVGGLTAAAVLARAGLHVRLFETEKTLGGYLAGFRRDGFYFDSSIQWLNQFGPGGFAARIFDHIGDGWPQCRPLHAIRRYKGDTFDYLLTRNPYDFRDAMLRDFPWEADGIRRLFADGRKLGERLPVLNDRMRSPDTMSLTEKCELGMKMLRWALPVRRFFSQQFDASLARYFRHPDILKVFHSDESLMSILVPISWAFSGDFQAPPAGGGMTLINWLAGQIANRGVQVSTGRKVREVLLERGRAAGVVLETGERVTSRYVVAACDVETLYEKMLPEGSIPVSFLKRLKTADLYYSIFSVFLGLDCAPDAFGFNEAVANFTDDRFPRQLQSCGDPRTTSLAVIAPSLRDPSVAPEGKGTLTIHCQAWLNYGDFWKTGPGLVRGDAYRRFKDAYAKILLTRLERMAGCDIRSHMVARSIATPVTYWRYTRNRDGSVMGAKPTSKNIRSGIAHYRTPVPRLFLGGHWAEIGGGVAVAMKAAVNTSLLILKDCKYREFEILRDCVDGMERQTVSS